jgi:DNA invertase Pin-like site-specific DNA recombinase
LEATTIAHRGKFVAYFRVSTDRQGKSGLGLEAQREAVLTYLDGGNWQLVGEFTEVESGKRSDRPQLAAALAACRRHKAKLVIAKLDRLSRNLAFIATMMERKVDFVAVDNPAATKFTLHILAAVAEHERDAISARTKAALAAAKARGVKLGNYQRIAEAKQRATAARDETLRAIVTPLAGQTMRAIAKALNDRGIRTARGGRWQAPQVMRLLDRLGL